MPAHNPPPPSSMQIVDHKVFENGRSGYRTFVLVHKRGRLYVATKNCKISSSTLRHVDLSIWMDINSSTPPQEINPANFYPGYQPSYTRFKPRKGEHKEDFHVKYRDILHEAGSKGVQVTQIRHTGDLTAREISMCEAVRVRPHPNIAEYYGVVTNTSLEYSYGKDHHVVVPLDKERVRSLVFRCYDCSLYDLVNRRHTFDIRFCLNSIAAGIQHLHKMGLVHSDIKPENIFVKYGKSDRHHFVVGDFDSTHRTGDRIAMKGGDRQWTRPKAAGDLAEEDDDWYAFGVLKKWIVKEFGERLEKYDEIGRKCGARAGKVFVDGFHKHRRF